MLEFSVLLAFVANSGEWDFFCDLIGLIRCFLVRKKVNVSTTLPKKKHKHKTPPNAWDT